MRVAWLAIGLALAASAAPQSPPPTGATPAEASTTSPAAVGSGAPKLEPYRFNARERTARALAAWEKGRAEEAVAPLDSALRLQPGNPLIEYNAGTAHLGANQPDAAELLEKAAKHAPPGLVADTYYNLGNARLAAKDAAGALEAYKNALRAQSDQVGAKRNLELALQMLEEQQKKQQEEKQDKDQQQKGEPKPDQQSGDGQAQNQDQKKDQDKNPPPPSDPDQNRSQPGEGDPQSGEPQPPKNRPLPQFEDQKDMTAEQAAAILQAVENLERQERRDQARAMARAKTSVEKDW